MNVEMDCGRAVPFLGIFVSNFRYWFFAVWSKEVSRMMAVVLRILQYVTADVSWRERRCQGGFLFRISGAWLLCINNSIDLTFFKLCEISVFPRFLTYVLFSQRILWNAAVLLHVKITRSLLLFLFPVSGITLLLLQYVAR